MSYIYPEVFDKVRRDRLMGFGVAFAFHLFLLWGGAQVLIEPVSYGVEAGAGSLEVSLVSAPAGMVEKDGILESPSVIPAADSIPVVGDSSSEISDRHPVAFSASGGATGQTGPGYLKNPAPRYPESSRKAGEQGVVVLWVLVSKDGEAADVRVKTGSGFSGLDEAAQKAVSRWRFKPALFGGFPVESEVEVPIRFQLEGN